MEPTLSARANRQDVIVRLRQQVAAGSYRPPVDELVNRLIEVVIVGWAAGGSAPGAAR